MSLFISFRICVDFGDNDLSVVFIWRSDPLSFKDLTRGAKDGFTASRKKSKQRIKGNIGRSISFRSSRIDIVWGSFFGQNDLSFDWCWKLGT